MYGHIHVCLKSMILENYGTEVWNTILRKADSDDSSDFMQFQQYPDDLTERLLSAAVEISGLDRSVLLEKYGEYFYHYVHRCGYSNMLRTLGEDYVSFLKHLNFLHTLLATTYEGMVPPHFRCEEVEGKIFLHFYSKRGRGLHKIAVGLAREVGIQLYEVDVETRLISVEALDDHPDGYKEYALIEVIINDSSQKTDDSPSKTASLSQLDCPMSSPCHHISNLVMSHCSFRSAAPYHVVVDENLTIRGFGNGLIKRHSNMLENKLSDMFRLTDPDIEFCYKQILLHLNKTFTLVTKSSSSHEETNNLTLKGQFIQMEDSSDLTYMGSPYFSSLHELANMNTCLTSFHKGDIVRELFFIKEKAKAEVQIRLFHLYDGMPALWVIESSLIDAVNAQDAIHSTDQRRTPQQIVFLIPLSSRHSSKQFNSTTAQLQKLSRALEAEKSRTDKLLHQMIPEKVADQLRQGKKVEAEKFEQATVLFSDIVTFTRMAAECEPMQIVAVLNELFQKFDDLTSVHDVYKVETIGDAYMVVSGVPEVITDHAVRIARMALDMVETAKQVFSPNTGRPIQIRVGMHTGPVVAGVVGQKMPRYCLFGDTVNTASRMESHGLPNHVHLTKATYQQLQGNGLVFNARGMTHIKGKGKMFTYFLLGLQPNHFTSSQNSFHRFKHISGQNDLRSPSRMCTVL